MANPAWILKDKVLEARLARLAKGETVSAKRERGHEYIKNPHRPLAWHARVRPNS